MKNPSGVRYLRFIDDANKTPEEPFTFVYRFCFWVFQGLSHILQACTAKYPPNTSCSIALLMNEEPLWGSVSAVL